MKGICIHFDGAHGLLFGKDGIQYRMDRDNILPSEKPNTICKNALIEFTPEPSTNLKKKPIAKDMKLICNNITPPKLDTQSLAGKLYKIDGQYGCIIGSDNEKYICHEDSFITEDQTIGYVRNRVKTATPYEPLLVTFTPGKATPNSHYLPEALNIRIK